MTSTIKFKHVDQLQKSYNENLVANPEIVNTNMDSDTALAVDTFVRGVIALTNDTYGSCEISMVKDITEWLEG